jgi:hypothetical protein
VARRSRPRRGRTGEGDEDDAAAAEAVGNGAVPQGHHGEGDAGRRRASVGPRAVSRRAFADFVERRQVGVDRERAERRQGGQQEGDAARRLAVAVSHGRNGGTGWLRRRAGRAMSSLPARSAMVRATLRMRCQARAERSRRVLACLSRLGAGLASGWQLGRLRLVVRREFGFLLAGCCRANAAVRRGRDRRRLSPSALPASASAAARGLR